MPTLTKKDIEKILAREAPGFRMAANQHVVRRPVVRGTARTPDLETIQRRFGNVERENVAGAARNLTAVATRPTEADEEHEDEERLKAVVIEPKDGGGMRQPKSVLIDVKTKRIVSSQG